MKNRREEEEEEEERRKKEEKVSDVDWPSGHNGSVQTALFTSKQCNRNSPLSATLSLLSIDESIVDRRIPV